MVRKRELTGAAWEEVDLDKAEWRIPAGKTKMKAPHIVPLSTQAVDCFRELKVLCCGSRYVLPHLGDLGRPMGRSTLNKALERMGYRGKFTVHGLRATASTILNEQGFKPDIIERQLAHVETNRVRAAYNRAEYLEEHRKMMQHWGDYLGGLREGGNVTTLRKAS
jgi:integrase